MHQRAIPLARHPDHAFAVCFPFAMTTNYWPPMRCRYHRCIRSPLHRARPSPSQRPRAHDAACCHNARRSAQRIPDARLTTSGVMAGARRAADRSARTHARLGCMARMPGIVRSLQSEVVGIHSKGLFGYWIATICIFCFRCLSIVIGHTWFESDYISTKK